jgi:hypothetical protein
MPCAMRDVSRHRRREFLPFHHSFGQPVKPFGARLAALLATPLLGPNLKLPPRERDGTAKEIIDQIKRDLATKYQHAEAFPSLEPLVEPVFGTSTKMHL